MKKLSVEFGLAPLCRVFGIPRSTASYQSVKKPASDISGLVECIPKMRKLHIDYGVKRMFKQLGKDGIPAKRNEVNRAYVELKLLQKASKRRVRTTDSNHGYKRWTNLIQGLEITVPDQVWVADVTGIYFGKRWMYLALVMDLYTRAIVGFALSVVNNTKLTLDALNMGFALGRSPEIHHSDQGSNYAADAYTSVLKGRSIDTSMAAVGTPEENGYAERLNRTVKYEEVRKVAYVSLSHLRQRIENYVCYYNKTRLHTSLGYTTPEEAFQRFWSCNAI